MDTGDREGRRNLPFGEDLLLDDWMFGGDREGEYTMDGLLREDRTGLAASLGGSGVLCLVGIFAGLFMKGCNTMTKMLKSQKHGICA